MSRYHPRSVEQCYSIDDLRLVAQRRLPRPIFDFLDGGSETEWTRRRNIAAFDDWGLIPGTLRDVTTIELGTELLGGRLPLPLILSPTGASRLFDDQGECAVARAASGAGIMYCLSKGATRSLEDVAEAAAGPKTFQLYVSDRSVTRNLVDRAKAAGYTALCLTTDVPKIGKRERDLRSGFGVTPRWTLSSIFEFATHPIWVARRIGRGRISLPHADREPPSGPVRMLTWEDVDDIAARWGGPIILKGIMSVDDARRAADAGVTAVMISNHGGRQLDGAIAPLDALPRIADAVGDRLELILDGGVRRGTHILKALALGANACAIGRPYLYGLAAGGEAGVRRALDILRDELELAMQLAGCTSVRDVPTSLVMSCR